MAEAVLYLMDNYCESEPINIGSGETVSIRELAKAIKKVTGYQGEILFDATKPDGMPVKQLENKELESLGWHSKVSLEEGLQNTYDWYCSTHS